MIIHNPSSGSTLLTTGNIFHDCPQSTFFTCSERSWTIEGPRYSWN